MPRLRSTNPIEQRLHQMAGQGGVYGAQLEELVKIYNVKFGLDKPLYVQYLNYWNDLLHLDLGQSLAFYPETTMTEIMRAAPWTIGLLIVSTIIAFALGTVFGALMAWPRTSGIALALSPLFMTLSAIPYTCWACCSSTPVAMGWRLLPVGAAFSAGATMKWDWPSAVDIGRHALLPGLSIVLSGIGSWALGMRAMMKTTLGEDYLRMAEASGLKPRTIFVQYACATRCCPR